MFRAPFSFEGRIRRMEYGISYFLHILYLFSLGGVFTNFGEPPSLIIILLMVPSFWFLFAQGAKRSHDVGNSGWFQFIPFYILWLIFAAGRKGKNKYGNDPKDNDEEEDVLQYAKPELANTPDENHLNT